MYSKRVKIFIWFCLILISICLIRLFVMQAGSSRQQVLKTIENMRKSKPVQLPTLRGKILDRKNRVLAEDEPRFYIYINYKLSRLLDEKWQFARLLRKYNRGLSLEEGGKELQDEFKEDIKTLSKLVDFCSSLQGCSRDEIIKRIKKINDRVWQLRSYVAWRKYYPGRKFSKMKEILPVYQDRISMAAGESIIEMYRDYTLVELKNEDDKFAAELGFSDCKNITVSSKPVRRYPYKQVACQVIGWVKPMINTTDDELAKLLAKDPLASYLGEELAGFKGVEWVCEPYLRGRRGQVEYNRDGELIGQEQTEFGRDIRLTIDAQLQGDIEKLLKESEKYTDFQSSHKAAVLIDVKSGDLLAVASVPGFDLNRARIDYSKIFTDPNKPWLNRAIEQIYPPGSTLKPLILLAAMEDGKISPSTVISCPAEKAPRGWPSCWIWRQFKSGHDYQWAGRGGNNVRNAIKGSCNIFCSRSANMLDGRVLQKWLYDFGFGRRLLVEPVYESVNHLLWQSDVISRRLRQSGGVIWSGFAKSYDRKLDDLEEIRASEKRMFGIGQGSMRATVLQIANEMATIARGGMFKQPRLFDDKSTGKFKSLGISKKTLATIKEGMYAVVNERNGTARRAFTGFDAKKNGVEIFGKTGSTQVPSCALFAGFFKDEKGRCIAMALIVEDGQSGSKHAAPLGREIIKLCIKHGYVGRKAQ